MSILNGFIKTKKYRKTDEGYKLQSQWASSQTVEMDDGSTVEETVQDLSQKISDTKDSIVTYTSNDVADGNATSWTSVTALTSGITHATFFQRVSQMFKNVRYLKNLLGTTNISKIDDGTVTGALGLLNSNLNNKYGPSMDGSTINKYGIAAATSMDLNDYKLFGMYQYTSSYSNTPTNAGGAVIVLPYVASYATQVAFTNSSSGSNIMYLRRYYVAGDTWSDWIRVDIANGGGDINGDLNITGNVTIDPGKKLILADGVDDDAYMRASSINNLRIHTCYPSANTTLEVLLQCTNEVNQFFPNTDGKTNLGISSYRWGQIYSSNSTISTSDRNLKDNIKPLEDDRVVDFIMGLKPSSYKLKDGTSGRTHYGMIAQDIEDLMNSLSMSSLDFAGFIKSPLCKEVTETDDDGNEYTIVKEVDDGEHYIYSLRYEEFIAPLIKMVQIQQEEIAGLKKQIEEIRNQILLK